MKNIWIIKILEKFRDEEFLKSDMRIRKYIRYRKTSHASEKQTSSPCRMKNYCNPLKIDRAHDKTIASNEIEILCS